MLRIYLIYILLLICIGNLLEKKPEMGVVLLHDDMSNLIWVIN